MKPDNSFFQLSTRKKLHRNNVNFHHIFILYPLCCLTLNQLPTDNKGKNLVWHTFRALFKSLEKIWENFSSFNLFPASRACSIPSSESKVSVCPTKWFSHLIVNTNKIKIIQFGDPTSTEFSQREQKLINHMWNIFSQTWLVLMHPNLVYPSPKTELHSQFSYI